MNFPRRTFLRTGCLALCGCLLPWPGRAAGPANYYASNRDRLLAEFAGVSQGMEQMTAGRIGKDQAGRAAKDALDAFAAMLPSMPEIGGESNRNQIFLMQAGWLASMHASLRPRGFTGADTGRLLYDMAGGGLAETPKDVLAKQGEAFFSREGRASLEKWAEWSQRRTYPGDWVGRVLVGDGSDFDLGYDMLECGAVKLFAAQAMMDVAPYFCMNDFPRSRAEGTGLVRSGNLAEGKALCDFRYKAGRPVTQDWDTETKVRG